MFVLKVFCKVVQLIAEDSKICLCVQLTPRGLNDSNLLPSLLRIYFLLAFRSCRLCFSRLGNKILIYMGFILPDILGNQLLKPEFWVSNAQLSF